MASAVRMPQADLGSFERNLRIPGPERGPLEILLTQFEAFHYRGYTKDIVANPFPDIVTDAFQGNPGQARL